MAADHLVEFDCDLCEYVLGQIRFHLAKLPARPRRQVTPLSYGAFQRLTLPVWLGRSVGALPEPLADHVWAGVAGDAAKRPLRDDELLALARVVDDPPMRREAECTWTASEGLHARYVECLPEIRSALCPTTAEEWAKASVAFGASLCAEGLSLPDGIEIVHDWVLHGRGLLRAMGVTCNLPAQAVPHSTTPGPAPATTTPAPLVPDDPRLASVVTELRRAIAGMSDGVNAKADDVLRQAGVRRDVGRNGLRWLETRGEFRGFARATPAKYRKAD